MINRIVSLICFLADLLQYSIELQICALNASSQWALFVYMVTAIGLPFNGIIIIYCYILIYTRRVKAVVIPMTNVLSISYRELRVLQHTLTLVIILGTAGLPSLIIIVLNAVLSQGAPVPLYLFSVLTISFCTNIQITFIFTVNKRVTAFLWLCLRRFSARLLFKWNRNRSTEGLRNKSCSMKWAVEAIKRQYRLKDDMNDDTIREHRRESSLTRLHRNAWNFKRTCRSTG
jgi:hypothetical protein